MSTGGETFDPYAQWLGLNLREQPLDHYLLLGLNRYEADPVLIEQQADERMRLVRSFQTGPRGRFTQKLMNELAAAKLCLLSPAAKRAYDEQLELWSQGSSFSNSSTSVHEVPAAEADLPASLPSAIASVLPPPLPPEAPLLAHRTPIVAEDADDTDEDEAGTTPMPMVIVGLVLGLIGVGIAGWMLSSYAMHRGWVTGGPPPGGPPPALVGTPAGKTQAGNGSSASFGAEMSSGERLVPDAGDEDVIEVLQEGSGDVVLSPATAVVSGRASLELEGTQEVLAGWLSTDDSASWRFRLVRPGFFQAEITYAASGEAFGRKLELSIDGEAKSLDLQPTRDGYRTDLLTIAVPKSGPHDLKLAPTSAFDGGLRVKLIRLKAVGTGGP